MVHSIAICVNNLHIVAIIIKNAAILNVDINLAIEQKTSFVSIYGKCVAISVVPAMLTTKLELCLVKG